MLIPFLEGLDKPLGLHVVVCGRTNLRRLEPPVRPPHHVWLEPPSALRIVVGCEADATACYIRIELEELLQYAIELIGVGQVLLDVGPVVLCNDFDHREHMAHALVGDIKKTFVVIGLFDLQGCMGNIEDEAKGA